jgi:hypothetical protein
MGGKRGRQSVDIHFHIKTTTAGVVLFPPVFLISRTVLFFQGLRGHTLRGARRNKGSV